MNKITKKFYRLWYKLSKIDRNLFLFKSYNGDYSDSPRFISEELHKRHGEKRIIWSLSDLSDPDVPDYVEKVRAGSKEEMSAMYKAGTIVTNVYGEKERYLYNKNLVSKLVFKLKTAIGRKKGQHTYTTWHGTSLKKMGIDIEGSNILDFSCPDTTMFLDNDFMVSMMKRLTFGKINIVKLGSPRVERLIADNKRREEIKKKLGLPLDKKIVLFAPSFRADSNSEKNIRRSGLEQLEMMNIEKLKAVLKKKFGGEWALVCRFHYHVSNMVDWAGIGGEVINGNKSKDMCDYLACCDVLITDVSSSVFDASIVKKKVFLFFPDLKHYDSKERGLCIPIKELPFSCSTTFTGLIEDINKYDPVRRPREVKEFLASKGYIDDNGATEKIVEYIIGNEADA